MLRRPGVVVAALLALLIGEAALGADPAPSESRLLDVLAVFEADGHAFVYARDLIGSDQTIPFDMHGPRTIAHLEAALESAGIGIEKADSGGRPVLYLVPRGAPDSGERPNTIEGRVTDAVTGQPLAGVRVEVGGQVVLTDDAGRFVIPASGSKAAVAVSGDGYQPARVAIDDRLEALLEIPLEARPRIEEVVVVSSRYALERRTRGSVHSLTARDLETVPEFGDDALRAATHLPGMASIGLSARPHVRGGLQDETLVLFNNVELLEPFHLKDFQSVFSGFNPSLVDSIDIYTGGFPARYGDRMSGVMDIRPTADRPGFGAEVMVSFLTASAAVAGTTASERGRWLLSARRGNLDLVLDVLDPSVGSPKYSDYFGSFSYALNAETELEVGFIFYDDDIELSELDDEDGELGRSLYRNGYGWMQLRRRWSDHMDSTTVLSYGHVRNDRSGFINDEDLEEGSSSLDDARRFKLWRLGHRQNLTLSDAVALEFGGQLNYQEGRYDTQALIERGEIADLIGIPIQEIRSIDRTARGTSGGVYGSVRYLPRQWLSLEGGLRWDYQDYGEEFEQYVSPRFSALVQLPTGTDLRFSAGRFYQPEEIHELQAADGVDTYQVAQYSDHYIVGISHVFEHPALSLGLELFDKRIHKPKRRFENLFNSLVLMPELASDRVEVAPSRARARGVEFSLAYEPSTNVGLWGSYTHAYADDRLEDAWVPRGWDQRHTVSAGVAWQPGNWTFSAAALWHSGWQTTVLPTAVAEDEDPVLERNADRLPEYFSLDLRIAREWRWAEQRLTVFFELTNATHRKNVGAYEYDVEEAEGGGYVLPREPVTLLPRMPSLGVRWNFR